MIHYHQKRINRIPPHFQRYVNRGGLGQYESAPAGTAFIWRNRPTDAGVYRITVDFESQIDQMEWNQLKQNLNFSFPEEMGRLKAGVWITRNSSYPGYTVPLNINDSSYDQFDAYLASGKQPEDAESQGYPDYAGDFYKDKVAPVLGFNGKIKGFCFYVIINEKIENTTSYEQIDSCFDANGQFLKDIAASQVQSSVDIGLTPVLQFNFDNDPFNFGDNDQPIFDAPPLTGLGDFGIGFAIGFLAVMVVGLFKVYNNFQKEKTKQLEAKTKSVLAIEKTKQTIANRADLTPEQKVALITKQQQNLQDYFKNTASTGSGISGMLTSLGTFGIVAIGLIVAWNFFGVKK